MFKRAFVSTRPPRSAETLRSASGRSERVSEAYLFAYVEPLSDARTKLNAIFQYLERAA
jgi:hypothetical protein